MALVRACSISDISPGGLKWVRVGGRDLVLANLEGNFYALNNWCTHEQGNLSEGELRNSILTCPEHGAQFDVVTGRVVSGPEGESADSISPQSTYKLTIQGNDVMVEIP